MQSSFRITYPQDLAASVKAASDALSECDVVDLDVFSAILALGRFEHARATLRDAQPDDPLLPLRAARYTAWTGDLRTLAGLWGRITGALQHADDLPPALRLATFGELAGPATDLGDPALSARLHALARAIRATTAAESAIPALTDDLAIAQRADKLADQATPATPAPCHDAADTVRDAIGRLGAEPDATRGRLRLRPDLTGGAISFEGLRFGDGAVALHTAFENGGLSLTATQESGAIPFTLLLEPIVAGRLRVATVDGTPASLTAVEEERGTRIPVQVVLDATRKVWLDLETDGGTT